MSETTKHDRIYLQVCDHEGDENFDCEFGDEITWCKDRINNSDVEYVRADLVAELERQLDISKAREAAYREEVVKLAGELAERDAEIERLSEHCRDYDAQAETDAGIIKSDGKSDSIALQSITCDATTND